jgi:hypothetical protein
MNGWRDVVWDGDVLRYLGPKGRKLLRVVPDQKYPGMWRVERPDGSLTDMANCSWAKDAATAIALSFLNARKAA